MGAGSQKRSLGVFALVMINVAAILSLRNLPLLSPYGLGMIFFYGIAAVAFFIPVALVSAELASMMDDEGGVYVWIRAALGEKCAFLGVWMSFVTTVTALTMTLIFIGVSTAYAICPSLSQSKFFVSAVVIGLTWGATLVTLKGMHVSALLTTLSSILGTLIPGILIVGLGCYWILGHRPVAIDLSPHSLVPKWGGFSQISLLVGIMFAFAGIEMSAYHVKDVRDPLRSYPRAIFYSIALILAISILGSLAISLVIPREEIRLEAGVIQAMTTMLQQLHLGWLAPIMGFFIAFGGAAYAFAWVAGPARGLLATRSTGALPPIFQRVNGQGMPVVILLGQAVVVTVCALLFLLMPSIGVGFWVLNAASSVMILVLYLFLLLAGPILRYRMASVKRLYRIPGGNWGMNGLALLGLANVIFCAAIAFVLPRELEREFSPSSFAWIVLATIAVFGCPPFIFYALKKEHWKTESF
jgi:amino acid transporter